MTQSARAAAQPPRRVLLTNDDGPDSAGSPFLRHWIEHVQRVLRWNCCVCIPASGQSFVSKSISRGPVKVPVFHCSPAEPSTAACARQPIYWSRHQGRRGLYLRHTSGARDRKQLALCRSCADLEALTQLHTRSEDHYEIEGSPATCVNIALHHLASDCDFVVAGADEIWSTE